MFKISLTRASVWEYFRPKPISRKFGLKMLLWTLLPIAFFTLFSMNYTVAFDNQEHSSIPSHSIYLVDKNDRTPQMNELIAFEAKGVLDIFEKTPRDIYDQIKHKFKDGQGLIKFVRALPGDRVNITSEMVYVNDIPVGIPGTPLHKTLGRTPEYFVREFIVGEGEMAVFGTADVSMDSRYLGAIPQSRIIGAANALN